MPDSIYADKDTTKPLNMRFYTKYLSGYFQLKWTVSTYQFPNPSLLF